MKYILMVVLLAIPVSAQADWSASGMHAVLGPNFTPNQVQAQRHISPPLRVEPQHRIAPAQPVVKQTRPNIRQDLPVRRDRPVNHYQDVKRHIPITPGYFRRDVNYYGYAQAVLPYSEGDAGIAIPDGFETILVDGLTYYYNDGIFYQEIAGQLTAIPPVMGAVVDYIPQDYQIVMADGTHYLFTDGVYYQRVDQGFEVVEPPATQDA